jgi:polyisoprenyl-phosphate glycosyltransferase
MAPIWLLPFLPTYSRCSMRPLNLPVAKIGGIESCWYWTAKTERVEIVAIAPIVSTTPKILSNLSIVAPCYNEERVIDELCVRLKAACEQAGETSYEIILVNDCSQDGTWMKITEQCNRDRRILGINLSRNHGHQLALSAGLALCGGQRVLVIDADLQDPPELLPQMLRLMEEGADVVYGWRNTRLGESNFKKSTATVFYRMLRNLSDTSIPVNTGDFRLMRREVVDVLNSMPEHHRFIRGMVSWIGYNQVAIPYDRAPRASGETGYPLRKMIRLSLDAITGFSTAPLRFSTYVACTFLLLALLLAIYVFYSIMFVGVVKGWASLFLAFLIFSSVQLFCLGLMGEYIGRIFDETKRRPLYVIKEVYRGASATALSSSSERPRDS